MPIIGKIMRRASRRHLLALAVAGGSMAFLPGCATPMREPAVPTGLAGQATVLGVPNQRFHPLISLPPLEAEFVAAVQRRYGTLASESAKCRKSNCSPSLAGGENGAFGAESPCGRFHGDRPVFELVTGVRTGALTAPFAYLGSSYDPQRTHRLYGAYAGP